MTADEARKLSDKNKEDRLNPIFKRIEAASLLGMNHCEVSDAFMGSIERVKLEGRGFGVYYYSGDQREPGFYTIVW